MEKIYTVSKNKTECWLWFRSWIPYCKEDRVPKKWCFRTVVLQKTLESPLVCKEIKPVNPKGSQSWIFIGRTDIEVETPVLWPPDVKNWHIGKDPDAEQGWKQGEKRMRWFFASGGQSTGALASASVLPINIQDWFPLGWTGYTLIFLKSVLHPKTTKTNNEHLSSFSEDLLLMRQCVCSLVC